MDDDSLIHIFYLSKYKSFGWNFADVTPVDYDTKSTDDANNRAIGRH